MNDEAISSAMRLRSSPAEVGRWGKAVYGLRLLVAGFLLRTHSQHEHEIKSRNIPIERDVALRTTADHELACISSNGSTDERVPLEHVDCFDDVLDASGGARRLMRDDVVEDAFEIIGDLRRELDARHVYFANFLALGGAAFFPAARRSRYSRISAQGIVLPDETISA